MVLPSVTSTSKSTKVRITHQSTADVVSPRCCCHYHLIVMITSKAYLIKIMKDCEGADTLTREEKFQVFCRVCDNMLNDGRMTKATHKRFTEIW